MEYEKIRAKAVRILRNQKHFDWLNTKAETSQKQLVGSLKLICLLQKMEKYIFFNCRRHGKKK
jgi:hypothetical protein